MIVYRVEDAEQRGPYSLPRGVADILGLIESHNHCALHPAELKDFIGSGRDQRFGFEGGAQASNWFKGFGKVLARRGFVVGLYEVPRDFVERGESGRQIRFCCGTRVGEEAIDWN